MAGKSARDEAAQGRHIHENRIIKEVAGLQPFRDPIRRARESFGNYSRA